MLNNKILLSLAVLLALSKISFSQSSNSAFLKNSYVVAGLSASYFSGYDIYDQELWRTFGGFNYRMVKSDSKYGATMGFLFGTRGARSFSELTYQVNRYVDFPIYLIKDIERRVDFKLGIQPSLLLYNATYQRGTRVLRSPNPHDIKPNTIDMAIVSGFSFYVNKTFRFDLSIGGSPIDFSSDENYNIHNFFAKMELSASIGQVLSTIKENRYKLNDIESKLYKLKGDGVVYFVLRSNNNQIKRFNDADNPDKANEYKENANEVNNAIIEAVKNNFNYCQFKFVYSDNVRELVSGEVYVNYEGKQIEPQDLSNAVICNLGSVYLQERAVSRRAYNFSNMHGVDLQYPFPSKSVYLDYDTDRIASIIKKINDQLQSQYQILESKVSH